MSAKQLVKLISGVMACTTFNISLQGPARADLFDEYKNAVSKKPFVSFFARSGTSGQSITGLGVNLREDLVFYEGLFGFYPDGEGKLTSVKSLFSTDGVVKMELEDLDRDYELKLYINQNDHRIVHAVLEKWKSDDVRYSLLTNNCNTFVFEVAQSVGGLNVPSINPGASFPVSFMKAFTEENWQSCQNYFGSFR